MRWGNFVQFSLLIAGPSAPWCFLHKSFLCRSIWGPVEFSSLLACHTRGTWIVSQRSQPSCALTLWSLEASNILFLKIHLKDLNSQEVLWIKNRHGRNTICSVSYSAVVRGIKTRITLTDYVFSVVMKIYNEEFFSLPYYATACQWFSWFWLVCPRFSGDPISRTKTITDYFFNMQKLSL